MIKLIKAYFKDPKGPLDRWYAEAAKCNLKNFPTWDQLKTTLRQGHWHQFCVKNDPGVGRNIPIKVLENYLLNTPDQIWDPEVLEYDHQDISFNVTPKDSSPGALWGEEFLKAGFPPFLFPSWLEAIKVRGLDLPSAQGFLNGFRQKPGLFLRLYKEIHQDPVRQDLLKNGFKINELGPFTWEVEGKQSIFLCDTWKKGLFQIQDWASQRVGEWVNAKPKDRILDLCAGKGGKTLILAQEMRNKGTLWALDVKEANLKILKQRIKHQDFQNVRIKTWDGVALPEVPVEIQRIGGFNKILIDAPCSASGTWHRDPEGSFKIRKSSWLALREIQRTLIEKAVKFLSDPGEIIYSTCSWLPEENENQKIPEDLQRKDLEYFGPPIKNSSWLFASRLFKKPSSD